jgi:spore germination cell wall hydrolase CwlJ-like protein
MTDRDAIALTLYGEARGEGITGLLAVAWVLRNRLRAGRWGTSYEAVCFAPYQFSCWNQADPNRPILQGILGGHKATLPTILVQCYTLADVLLNEAMLQQLGSARHYYAAASVPPAWAAQGVLVASVHGHKFFEGVPA